MNTSIIYSIGHGNKYVQTLVDELQLFGIKYLIDVRSKPYSKFASQFNKPELERSSYLSDKGVKYVFMGDQLGGRPSDRSCYDSEGKVDYSLVADKPFFRHGLDRLVTACKKNLIIALMCSESNPEKCHRSKLIGKELLGKEIYLQHIISEGNIKEQREVISDTMFELALTSRKTYLK